MLAVLLPQWLGRELGLWPLVSPGSQRKGHGLLHSPRKSGGERAHSRPRGGCGTLSQDHCERLQVRSNLTPRRDGVKGTQRTRPLLPKRGSSSLLGAWIQGTGASQAGTESPLSCVSWGCSLNLSGPPLPLPISRARRGNPSKNPRPAIPGLSHYFPLTFACSPRGCDRFLSLLYLSLQGCGRGKAGGDAGSGASGEGGEGSDVSRLSQGSRGGGSSVVGYKQTFHRSPGTTASCH